jgi:alkaline phosphatase
MSNKLSRILILGLACATVARAESPRQWYRDGRAAVEQAKKLTPITGKAKNVILLIGDGMNVATVTAARIFEGQQRGESGEENSLSFERLPYTALIKTYNVDQQVPDSAGTMTAIVTGVKSNGWMLSVNERVVYGDHDAARRNKLTTILELAERAGLSTGIVTTARVTHATPAACFGHAPNRSWEADSNLPDAAKASDFPDLARQLIEFPDGNGLEVVLGGGRRNFLPRDTQDPEYEDKNGRRADGRDLTAEWLRKPNSAFVWREREFAALDVGSVDHLLGLFQPSHMQYEHDRSTDEAGEPSLSEMTSKAIDLLSKNAKGYFLMVESARIDHAHHANNPYRALTDTVEFAKAVRAAQEKTKRSETLIIVTADHGHLLAMGGYARRGNPILGKVVTTQAAREAPTLQAEDALGRPYTTLQYTMGPGYTGPSADQLEGPKRFPHRGRGYEYSTKGRPDLSEIDTTHPDYLSETAIPADDAEHGGEDVALYADGPQAHLFRGVLEQNVIFHVMVEALGLKDFAKEP